ncbi:DUF4097 domain-containing protein [Paenibacillus sp. N3/727]|uniref:DUF4097 family beta strand repeat-containing protein n=1 Tax=Paenibacillus sp. N3/727 TaxID=2925845 RepID=UPI001F52BE6E|nr:DUF4097 family beta strand repeat-containing protein [Paenibacillus sp. N3/727]UNK19462.1 DUF4097 domain-containing protein [Paenibacillus sp. N3/727]
MKTNKWIWLLTVVALVGVLYITSQIGSEKLEITEHIPSEEVQSIEITNDSWDIEVKESTDNEVHVDINGKQKDKKKVPVSVTHQDHKLIIQQNKQIGGALSAFTFEKEGTITILVPKNTVEQVTLINKEGDLDIHTLASQKLTVKNQAGNVKFNQVEADSGVLNLIVGDLTVNNSSFGNLDVVAKANDLYFNNTTSTTSSVWNVFSEKGEIVLKGIDEKGELNVETKTGDIQVGYSSAPSSLKVAVENTKGDTTVNLANLSTTNNTDEEINGMIGAGEYLLHLKSHSGNIAIK